MQFVRRQARGLGDGFDRGLLAPMFDMKAIARRTLS